MILRICEQNLSYLKTRVSEEKNKTEPDKRSIVFIHGASFNKDSWAELLPCLQDKYLCYAPDFPGHGDSPGKGYTKISDYSNFILNFIKDMKLESPVICGLSMGGAVVLDLMLKHQSLFSAGILMNTGPFLSVSDRIFNAVRKRYSAYVNMLVSFGTSEKSDRDKIQVMIKKMSQCNQNVACRDFEACNGFDVQKELKNIKCPVLIIGGKDDKITPVHLSESLHENISGSEINIMYNTGHFPIIENPEKTAIIMIEYLNKNSH